MAAVSLVKNLDTMAARHQYTCAEMIRRERAWLAARRSTRTVTLVRTPRVYVHVIGYQARVGFRVTYGVARVASRSKRGPLLVECEFCIPGFVSGEWLGLTDWGPNG